MNLIDQRRASGSIAFHFAGFALVAAASLVASCSGSNGSQGPPGPPGPPGGGEPTDTHIGRGESAPGLIVTIVSVDGASGADGTFQVGDTVRVTFTLTKNDGSAWMLSEMSTARMLLSGPSFNYQRVLPQVTDVETASVENANGSFTYTFATPIPAAYAAPYNDTATFGSGEGELSGQALLAGTYTVGAYFAWSYTVEDQPFRDVGNAEKDVLFLGALAVDSREVVKQVNCNQCHEKLQAHGGMRRDVKLCLLCHTAGSEDANDPGLEGGTPDTTLSFKVMIHKIHNGEHLPSVLGVATHADGTRDYSATPTPYVITELPDGVTDFSEVAFPVWPNLNVAMPRDLGYSALTSSQKTQEDTIRTGVTDCNKCHGDPDGSGPLTAPAQGAVAFAQPSRQACGACHDDISWTNLYTANNQTMPAQLTDSACIQCHAVSGTALAVQDAHLHPLHNGTLNPGVNFIGSGISGGTGAGGNFQAGDRPSITFAIQNDAGTDIPLASLNSASAVVVGPTSNRQIVMPYPGPNNVSISPYDFAGRLASGSTTNKGTMSRILFTGAPVTEILTVEFTSATAFGVTGSVSGNLGASALSASPSTNPSGSSISAIDLSSSAVAETVTVAFFSAVDFTVTGSVSGAMGSGRLPAATNGSVRFTSTNGALSFTATVGTTAFSSGNSIYLTIFQGAAANPVLFAIAAGRTSFAATDRFYYELVAPAASYTLKIPMDLPLEFLGDGDGNIGQTLTAGNLPVYFGRQTLNEVTTVAVRTTLSASAKALDREVDVVSTANFAVNDYCVLEGAAGVGTREYVQVGYVESATRMWFKTPLRYAHAVGATADEPTLTYRQEGAANRYMLTPATGVVTSVVAFGAGNGIVMTYRTDGRFGYLRHGGDALQASYAPPHNDSPSLGQDWGEWKGLSFEDGTYTASIWGARSIFLGLFGEVQTYQAASTGANVDFLYGATATTIEPYAFISSSATCYACHSQMLFHGGGRSGVDTCLLCHGVAGAEDWPQYNPPTTNPVPPNNGVTINFRTMLHKIHRGKELANASTYTVYGNQASANTYGEVLFPAMPNGVQNCRMCHGTSDAWMGPSPREHSGTEQTVPTRSWRAVCNACHDSDAATAHIDAQTAPSGYESCEVCHGADGQWSVELMHKTR
jgi:OmcA/MtrC family decaheme c-type cytochrome